MTANIDRCLHGPSSFLSVRFRRVEPTASIRGVQASVIERESFHDLVHAQRFCDLSGLFGTPTERSGEVCHIPPASSLLLAAASMSRASDQPCSSNPIIRERCSNRSLGEATAYTCRSPSLTSATTSCGATSQTCSTSSGAGCKDDSFTSDLFCSSETIYSTYTGSVGVLLVWRRPKVRSSHPSGLQFHLQNAAFP
jgi:hypothetical protein